MSVKKPGQLADAKRKAEGLAAVPMIDPQTIRSWCVGFARWLADHPIDYDNLHNYMGGK